VKAAMVATNASPNCFFISINLLFPVESSFLYSQG
jgi:hypothetical protein